MTERSLLQRARPARLALGFATLVAALAGAALATPAPAAALSPGCTEVTQAAQGLNDDVLFVNVFEAGERLTFQAGPPVQGAPVLMGLIVTHTALAVGTSSEFSSVPGTLVYDFPLTGLYTVWLLSLPGESTWNVMCGPVMSETPLRELGIPRVVLCSPTLALRADGTMGHAFDVEFREWKADPSYVPAGAVPARYYEGVGLDCSNLPGYTNSGRMTDGLGTDFGSLAPIVEGAVYPYFKKS